MLLASQQFTKCRSAVLHVNPTVKHVKASEHIVCVNVPSLFVVEAMGHIIIVIIITMIMIITM